VEKRVNQLQDLDGKVAIVTGAGSSGPGYGTGRAISVLLAQHGAQVVLVDRVEERARETLDLIERAGGNASVLVADLGEVAECRRVVKEAVARHGSVDILVNNAAISSPTSILETSDELYDSIVAVNMTAPFMLSKAVIPVMIEHGGGSIVNITSIMAMRGTGGAGSAAYATTKAAMMGLMTDLADAYGRSGVRVNCVAPGIIDTPMRAQALQQAGFAPGELDLSGKTSLGFEGDAWDIARAVLFLAGPDGRYVTGVLLPIDGGTTARSH
jgi:NAD(P)-dependent dehydrogenase (short-subunit alcohol dehydrogenase family)